MFSTWVPDPLEVYTTRAPLKKHRVPLKELGARFGLISGRFGVGVMIY